jgi:hypothetical protein
LLTAAAALVSELFWLKVYTVTVWDTPRRRHLLSDSAHQLLFAEVFDIHHDERCPLLCRTSFDHWCIQTAVALSGHQVLKLLLSASFLSNVHDELSAFVCVWIACLKGKYIDGRRVKIGAPNVR